MDTTAALKVQGMGSDHCAGIVKKVIESFDSVKEAKTSFANMEALIIFKEDSKDLNSIINAIRSAGYDPSLAETDDGEENEDEKRALHILKNKTIVGAIFSSAIILVLSAPMLGIFVSTESSGLIQLALTLPVLVWTGGKIFTGAYSKAMRRIIDMDTLIALGTGAAFLYSLMPALAPALLEKNGIAPETYFETTAVIITFIVLGKYLEERARKGTSEAIRKLLGLQAKTARVIRSGKETDIPIAEVRLGDIIIVRPGEKIPVDGERTEGPTGGNE